MTARPYSLSRRLALLVAEGVLMAAGLASIVVTLICVIPTR